MSHQTGSESYVPILEDGGAAGAVNRKATASPAPSSSGARWVVMALVLVAAVAGTWLIAKDHYNHKGPGYDRERAYQPPARMAATLEFSIPYINFSERVEVTASGQNQRLSYYGGADVYTFSPELSLTIVPVFTTLTCLSSNGSDPVAVFPDLSKFSLLDESQQQTVATRAHPAGVLCDVWEYTYLVPTRNPQGNASAILPDAEGYTGHYQFLVSAADGTPVRFQARQGHNVVLGGSHYDFYQLDYLSVAELPFVDEAVFGPPAGMECYFNEVPVGPTRLTLRDGSQITRSHAGRDIEMLFPHGEETRSGLYADYMARHGKSYASEAERNMRAGIFHNNVRLINGHNRANKLFTLTANHLADWTEAELRSLNGRLPRVNTVSSKAAAAAAPAAAAPAAGPVDSCGVHVPVPGTIPDSVDWRGRSLGGPQADPGYVNPAADQGTCGSCWSFGAAAAAEAAHYRRYGVLPRISQQNILDCTWDMGNTACGGGQDFLGYSWLLQHNNGSWASDASYGGYLNQDGFCHYALDKNLTRSPSTGQPVAAGTQLQSCWHVTNQFSDPNPPVTPAQAVANLTEALAHVGVLSVAIDATQPTFYFYEQGWYYNPQCGNTLDDLDHQVTAVGYETGPDGNRYTIVRNSWSSYWGENGFVKMSMVDNNCGVGTVPTYVTVY